MSNQKFSKFYGFRGPLCNLRYSDFTLDGVKYHSVDQYLASQKAELFGDTKAKGRIMECKTPIDCRRVKIANFNEEVWMQNLDNILWAGLLAKFLQNSGARKYLLKTEGSKLVYCDPWDKILGIGIDRFHDDSNNPDKWGQNRLGIALEKIRENVIGRPEFQNELKIAREEAKK